MLRSHRLCQTPREELERRFAVTETAEVPRTPFAINLRWMLQCCLISHPSTKYMILEFVQDQGLGIDVIASASTVKVSDNFLSFDSAHNHVSCGEVEPNETSPFACDHIVLQLWDNVLSLLPATPESEATAKEESQLKSMVGKRLAQMPRTVKCVQTCRRGELIVTWESNESMRQANQPVTVVAHAASCNRAHSPSIIEDELHEGKHRP